MSANSDAPFPCPFCNSSRVVLIGGGLVFLHYQCAQCAEVWTAMGQPRISRPASDHEPGAVLQDLALARPTTKFWRH